MIVLDASVLISYWGAGDTHADSAFDIVGTEEELILHPVTLADSLVGPVRIHQERDALEDLGRLGVERHVPVIDEPLRVARLRAATASKLPDAYVLATAMELDATLATFDRRLAEVARSPGVAVLEPDRVR